MIEVYSWPTPNGHKVHIMLEECRLAYRVHPVDIGAGEQFFGTSLGVNLEDAFPDCAVKLGRNEARAAAS